MKILSLVKYLFTAFLVSCSLNNSDEQATARRIEKIISEMTLEEMIHVITGSGYWQINGVERLGIPTLNTSNGPVGVRPMTRTPLYPPGVHDSVKATAFPVPVAMASTWNKALVKEVGQAMGTESRWKNIHYLLGPGLNIQRVPYGGRNFEYFSEDPFLTAQMGIAAVKGIQSQGVMTSVKHFACNNTEFERHSVNINVDERTLHEIYLYAYRKVVEEANPFTFMSAYNRVNNKYSSENKYLLNDILKDEWGFKGFVMSDWGATRPTHDPVLSGLDVEMPREIHFGDKLLERVERGEVDKSVIEDKVRRVLWAVISSGVVDNFDNFRVPAPDHREICTRAATEGIVLLKNEQEILPLDIKRLKSIAVIGPNAEFPRTGGWGSSYVCPVETVSPLDGLRELAGMHIEIGYEPGIIRVKDIVPVPNSCLLTPNKNENGLLAEYFPNTGLEGKHVIVRNESNVAFDWGDGAPEGLSPGKFSARFTGFVVPEESSVYNLAVSYNEGIRLYIDDKLVIDTWNAEFNDIFLKAAQLDRANYLRQYRNKHIAVSPGILKTMEAIDLEKGRPYKIRLEYKHSGGKAACILEMQKKERTSIEEAARVAAEADVAVVFAGIAHFEEREAADLPSLYLPEAQDELIKAVVSANPNTIVVLNNGTPLLLNKWIDDVPALLEAWYPGQYGGEVIASVLFGLVNPSGKLPVTFMKDWKDTPVAENYPIPQLDQQGIVDMNVDDSFANELKEDVELRYTEGLFVGYRHYDTKGVEPLFAFGHGLSYADFEFADLKLRKEKKVVQISLNITNTGGMSGHEVVQVYVQCTDSKVVRPLKELKGFQKVFLNPEESKPVVIEIPLSEMRYYDTGKGDWTFEHGNYKFYIGASSRDIRLTGNLKL